MLHALLADTPFTFLLGVMEEKIQEMEMIGRNKGTLTLGGACRKVRGHKIIIVQIK